MSNVVVQGDVLLRAKLQIEDVSSQVGQLTKELGKIKFGDKGTKELTSSLTRILQMLPTVKKQLEGGMLDEDEMSRYVADSKMLTKEMQTLARVLRGMPKSQIEVDSAQLDTLATEIDSLKDKIGLLKKGFKLNAAGYLGAQKEVSQLVKTLNAAAASGKNVEKVFNAQRTAMADASSVAQTNTDKLEDRMDASKDLAVDLAKEAELYERIAQALRATKGNQAHSPTLKADLAAIPTELRDDTKAARGNTAKAVVVETALANKRLEMDAATEKARQSEEAYNKQRQESIVLANKLSVIDVFKADNLNTIRQFDYTLTLMTNTLGLTTTEAVKLENDLKGLSQVSLDRLAQILEKLASGANQAAGATKEFHAEQKKETAATQQSVEAFKRKISQMFGLYNVYQLIRKGIRSAYGAIKDLDSAMNSIAVVTNMTTNELWGQIDAYMAVAKQYGVSTKGVYEVSKLYYQQGRDSAEVTQLTAETLKMAKIAGLDYGKATDNMTVALNGFKLAASEANVVVDVYAQLAARSAVSTEELAYAMSKTASIAESAGMSFENTSVFLAKMIETTREAPENIGTAMKTIIARFTEMKKSPLDLLDVDGEEVSFNRVDTALQSIGMSLQDVSGQFADLDGIIYELAGKWDTLDRNTQRYIATTVAGSRQQSRFLALMQDSERLLAMQDEAMNAEDAGLVQYAKTLDSIETKLAQLKTSIQQFYMAFIQGPLVKGFLQMATTLVTFLNNVPKHLAVTMVPGLFILFKVALKTIGTFIIGSFRQTNNAIVADNQKTIGRVVRDWLLGQSKINAIRAGGTAANAAGKIGGAVATGLSMTNVIGWALTAVSLVSLFASFIQQSKDDLKSAEQRLKEYKDNLENANIARATAKSELDDLVGLKKRYDELSKSKDENNEKYEEWLALNKQIYDKYPSLLKNIDDENNAIVELGDGYTYLAEQKALAYEEKRLAHVQAMSDREKSAITLLEGYVPDAFKSTEGGFREADKIKASAKALADLQRAEKEYDDARERNPKMSETSAKNYEEMIAAAENLYKSSVSATKFKEQGQSTESWGGNGESMVGRMRSSIDSIIFSAVNAGENIDALFERFGDAQLAKYFSYTKDYEVFFADKELDEYGNYTTKDQADFLRKILDPSFSPKASDETWSRETEDIRTLLTIFPTSWEQLVGSLGTAIENDLKASARDWATYYAPEADYERNSLYKDTILTQGIEKAWDDYKVNLSEDADMGVEYSAFIRNRSRSVFDQLDEQWQDDLQDLSFAEDFDAANELYVNASKYSVDAVEKIIKELDKEIVKQLDMSGTGEGTFLDRARAVSDKRASQLYNAIAKDRGTTPQLARVISVEGKSTLQDVDESVFQDRFAKMSVQTQQSLLSAYNTLSKLAVSTEDMVTSIPTGKDSFVIAQNFVRAMSEIAEDYELSPQALNILDNIDPTSVTSIYEAVAGLQNIDDEAAPAAARLKKFADQNLQMTPAEASQTVLDFYEAREDALKTISKPIDVKTRESWITDGTFEEAAFRFNKNGEIIFADNDAALAVLMQSREELMRKALSTEGMEEAAKRFDELLEQEGGRKELTTFLGLMDAFDPDKFTVDAISEELYFSLAPELQEVFTKNLEGAYEFTDALAKPYLYMLRKFYKDDALFKNIINKGLEDATQMSDESMLSLAQEVADSFDDDGKFTISDKLKDDLIEAGIYTKERFEQAYQRTMNGWVSRFTQADDYEHLQRMFDIVSRDKGIQSVIEEIFTDADAKRLEKQVKDARKQLGDVTKSINLEDATITLGRELYEVLGDVITEGFVQTDLDEWTKKIVDPETLADFLKQAINSIDDLTDDDKIVALTSLKKEVDDYNKAFMQSVVDNMLGMLDDAEGMLAASNSGGFDDKITAQTLAYYTRGRSGLDKVQQNAFTGQWEVEGENAIALMEEFYEGQGRNLYDQIEMVGEVEKNLRSRRKLEKDLGKLTKKGQEDKIDLTQRELALQKQLAAAIADMTFDPQTYAFMDNSQTNVELDTMYTLLANTQSAYDSLNTAFKEGKMDTKELNAILDYVGRDDPRFAELSKLAITLTPPLETTITKEQIKALSTAVEQQTQKEFVEYVKRAEDYNKNVAILTREMKDEGPYTKLDESYTLFGNKVDDLTSAYTTTERVIGPAEMTRLVQQASAYKEAGVEATMSAAMTRVLMDAGYLVKEQSAEDVAKSAEFQAMVSALEPLTNFSKTLEDALAGLGLTADAQQKVTDSSVKNSESIDAASKVIDDVATELTTSKTSIATAATGVSDSFGSVGTAAETLASRLNNVKLSGASDTPDTKTSPTNKPTYLPVRSVAAADGGQFQSSVKNALVGELGPELLVSKGQYNLVGARGPEFVDIPAKSFILDHRDTAMALNGGSKRASMSGKSFAYPGPITIPGAGDLGNASSPWVAKPKTKKEDDITHIEFDRWYNFLTVIKDVTDAIAELAAERENLSGIDLTASLVNEMALIEQQASHVERYLSSQQAYRTALESNMTSAFSDYLSVVDGVLQVKWNELTALEDDVGAPILEAITEWDSLTDSISKSKIELEGFQSQLKKHEDSMRKNYIEVEKQVIDGIKNRQQLIITNLQKELDMKLKYDNKYLSALKDNISKERKMRERSNTEEDRAKLQRKLSLLQRDTSGKSDLAIAGLQQELKSMNQTMYDQRQDDFVESEEDALVAAQEALQEEIEIQTEVLTFMGDNIQLIQETVDSIMTSGPENLQTFLQNWNKEYLDATPTNQDEMDENFKDISGQVEGYIDYLGGSLVASIQELNLGLTGTPITAPSYELGKSGSDTKEEETAGTYTGRSSSKITGKTYTATSTTSQKDADAKAKKKRTDAEAAKVKADAQAAAKKAKSAGGVGKGNVSNMLYAEGGLVDYTGPAIVHGSKSKPEAVLNPRQTSIFQQFTGVLDEMFNGNMRAGMVQSYTPPSAHGEGGPTVVVENITLTSGVIAKDYDARRAGDLVKEEILKIAKYQGGMSIGRK